MIEYVLDDADLAEVRFGVSPLTEAALSLRAIRDPGRFPLHLPWLSRVQEALPSLDEAMLRALTNEQFWTPDFLTPRPLSPLTRIEDELDRLADLSPAVVARDIEAVHPGRRPPALAGPARAVRSRVVHALREYWDACLADPWPRMRNLLEADVIHRGRLIVQSGIAAMFASLSQAVSFADGVVAVRLTARIDWRVGTGGDGLVLSPTQFSRRVSTPVDPTEPPLIMYPVRGLGTLWSVPATTAPAALAGVLGRVRARLLVDLATPRSSTELAERLQVTPSAVNQHLRALRAAGLLTSTRYGRSVLYVQSALGTAWLGSA